jgi:predicted nucleic acid-binding protein
MRDIYDYPILATAILEDIDVLITGDKDFAAVDIERPEILTPTEFLSKY